MLDSVRGRLLTVLAALGLSAGLVLTVTQDGCTVKPVEPTDAGVVDQQSSEALELEEDSGSSSDSGT